MKNLWFLLKRQMGRCIDLTSSYSESKLILFLRTILSFLLAINISVVGVAFCFSTNKENAQFQNMLSQLLCKNSE